MNQPVGAGLIGVGGHGFIIGPYLVAKSVIFPAIGSIVSCG